MYTHSDALTTLFDLLHSLSSLISHLNAQQQAARKKGLELYHLGEFEECETPLTISASAGDVQSQYALGEAIRRREGSIGRDARAWYRLAAAQGHVYALMRLGDEASQAEARSLAQAAADAGDGDAKLQLYELTQDQSWLVKAGQAGCAEAYYIAALLLDKKTVGDNTSTRDSMLRYAATAQGYPPAMAWLANMRDYYNNIPYQQTYLERRLALNELNAVLTYATALAGFDVDDNGVSRYGYATNPAHAYGLFWLVTDSTRQHPKHRDAAVYLQQLTDKLDAEKIEAGKAFGRQWKAGHPALSEFRLTYSDLK